MKKFLVIILMLFIVTGCGAKQEATNNTNQKEQVQEKTNKTNVNENTNTKQEDEQKIVVENIVNCEGCVFSYFSDDRTFGSTLTDDEYTTDINNLKTMGGNQRHNFFGFVLNENKIERAYSCILKDNNIYCIEGTANGGKFESNIGVINQIFTADQCKYISDGHTYTCTDGHYNARTTTQGDADLHFETSCRIVILTNSVKISCV